VLKPLNHVIDGLVKHGLNHVNHISRNMNTQLAHRYILEPYKGPSSRIKCPACGKPREFSRYLDRETNTLLPDHVGRCNREEHCGYHYTAKQFHQDNSWNQPQSIERPFRRTTLPERNTDFLSMENIEDSTKGYKSNRFVLFLDRLFGESVSVTLRCKYLIGSSRHWKGATIFWQVDKDLNVRQAKVMLYNSQTGRRIKSEELAEKYNHQTGTYFNDTDGGDKVFFAGKRILNNYEANLKQCFYGEHLLAEENKTVAIVESEKTAIISSVYYPKFTWLATGGKNGCRWTDLSVCKVLEGREVVLFPDLGQFNDWNEKANKIVSAVSCKIYVSDVLERSASEEEKRKGYDLADFLLKIDSSGIALNNYNYPVIWDYK